MPASNMERLIYRTSYLEICSGGIQHTYFYHLIIWQKYFSWIEQININEPQLISICLHNKSSTRKMPCLDIHHSASSEEGIKIISKCWLSSRISELSGLCNLLALFTSMSWGDKRKSWNINICLGQALGSHLSKIHPKTIDSRFNFFIFKSLDSGILKTQFMHQLRLFSQAK